MSAIGVNLPPFDVLAAALRTTTERLAGELARPAATAPEWNELEWTVARAAAALQGISGLLAARLRWRGPPSWQTFLAEQRTQARLRDEKIGGLVAAIDAALRDADVACVALKGAALRSLGVYAPGERPMGDVDLLVHARDLEAVDGALRRIDYGASRETRRHVIYEPRRAAAAVVFGEHVDNPLKIEVHAKVDEELPVRRTDITARLWPAAVRTGINPYRSTEALATHLLLHAAGNMRAHALRQIQLHDLASVPALDWGALCRPDGEPFWWMFPPLTLVERYYPGTVPSNVLGMLERACPRALRVAMTREVLTDVSWSNLRIHAVPGIAWSRTPLEALRYVRSRALPSRVSLSELERSIRAQPMLARVPWYGVSQASRIARWLVSRPPRVQTILALEAMFATAQAARGGRELG